MNDVKPIFLDGKITYTGAELRPHWIFERTRRFGSAIVAFRGPFEVATSELVDLEDKSAGDFIRAREMLHFLGEFFGETLELTIARQRLFTAVVGDAIRAQLAPEQAARILREGDDLYWIAPEKSDPKRKLSVSIVTATPVSTLLHFGLNIDATGAPVAAAGLLDLGLDATRLVEEIFHAWETELESQRIARCKVIPR